MIDDHDIPRDPHLVAVRGGIGKCDGRHAARLGGIGDIEDGGAELRTIGDMAHIGVRALHGDLAGSSQIEMANPPDIAGERACTISCAAQCHVLSTSSTDPEDGNTLEALRSGRGRALQRRASRPPYQYLRSRDQPIAFSQAAPMELLHPNGVVRTRSPTLGSCKVPPGSHDRASYIDEHLPAKKG